MINYSYNPHENIRKSSLNSKWKPRFSFINLSKIHHSGRFLYWYAEIALRHGLSPVNLMNIFRTPSSKNTSGGLFLDMEDHQIKSFCDRRSLIKKSHKITKMLQKVIKSTLHQHNSKKFIAKFSKFLCVSDTSHKHFSNEALRIVLVNKLSQKRSL